MVDELLLQKLIMQLLNTTHNHMTHIDHKINPLDKRQKKIQLGDLKKQFHIVDLNTLSQKDELQFHLWLEQLIAIKNQN